MMNRRSLLCSTLSMLATPVLALGDAPLAAITDYERITGGQVGLYAENVRTGAKAVWRHHERFLMCSSFKASLAAFVLNRVDQGKTQLNELVPYGPNDIMEYAPAAKENLKKGAMSVSDMCKAAVELSDNTCANVLLAHVGGPSALTAYWRSIGDGVTRLTNNEPELNYARFGDPDTTTPAATAGNLRKLILGKVLSPESRKLLTGWMLECKTGSNRLRAGLAKDWRIADKTGNNGVDAFIDISVSWSKRDEPVLICAYTRDGSPRPDQVDALFAGIGHFVSKKLA